MHRASLRVIIPVPELAPRTNARGRYSGRMGTYERLVHRFEDAEGTPWQGEAVSDAAFWSGTLAVSWAAGPDTTDLEAPVYRAHGPCSRAVGIAFRRTRPQLVRNGRSA
jgi:hypothetical protein